ncbi:transposase, IS4 family protein [Sphaerospermopsis reniformis]|uniref:Transposase, IS4 family protein n=1 Tax=Sphaerospermopsis reniformis TaxID=531300 RepID=A0A480A884_9CYAN|nr:transposase, IS4 family protein [Sphaerospermopsis reniformis]
MRKQKSKRPDPPWIQYIKQHTRHYIETVFSSITSDFPKSLVSFFVSETLQTLDNYSIQVDLKLICNFSCTYFCLKDFKYSRI